MPSTPHTNLQQHALFLVAGFVAFSAIAYELLLASYATFLLGASYFQYSLVLSLMMLSMGVGALLAPRFQAVPITTLVFAEIFLSLLAAVAIPILYCVFALSIPPHPILILFICAMGACIGLEIPLLNQALNSGKSLTQVLFFDYFGGFVGGLLFPLWFLPKLGFFKSGAFLSLVNAVIGLVLFLCFYKQIKTKVGWSVFVAIALLVASFSFIYADTLRRYLELHWFNIYEVL